MEMTTDYHERTRLFSAKSFVGNIFAMSTPWLFALANTEAFKGTGGNEADGMRYVSLLIAAFLVPLSLWWFIKLREPGFVKVAKQEKTPFWKDMKSTVSNRDFIMLVATIFTLAMGFNFVNLLGSYIPIFYVFGGDKVAGARLLGINGTIWAISGVLAVFPLNWISPKLGKRNTLIVSMLLMCLAQLSKIICYNPQHPYLIIIPTMLLSTGMLFFFTLGSSMVGDICDEDELKTGHRTEGSFYAVYWWFIKMGTALASFVAGVLIVFTMFDEIQVTKVDYLQGSVREIRSMVSHWKNYGGMADANVTWLDDIKKQGSESLEESREYLSYLEKESAKKPDQTGKADSVFMRERKTMLLEVLVALKSNTVKLEKLQSQLNKLEPQAQDTIVNNLIKEAIPLALAIKIEKASLNSSELLIHLKARSLKTKNSKDHYNMLVQNIYDVNNRIGNLKGTLPLDTLDQELSTIEHKMVPMTKQTPYTLLMMRVVEIGLPFLLCIISFLFILRYSLTEKRCHEIKEFLRQRNNMESAK
jgi:Na+/melibiose symporter-like transporter